MNDLREMLARGHGLTAACWACGWALVAWDAARAGLARRRGRAVRP